MSEFNKWIMLVSSINVHSFLYSKNLFFPTAMISLKKLWRSSECDFFWNMIPKNTDFFLLFLMSCFSLIKAELFWFLNVLEFFDSATKQIKILSDFKWKLELPSKNNYSILYKPVDFHCFVLREIQIIFLTFSHYNALGTSITTKLKTFE